MVHYAIEVIPIYSCKLGPLLSRFILEVVIELVQHKKRLVCLLKRRLPEYELALVVEVFPIRIDREPKVRLYVRSEVEYRRLSLSLRLVLNHHRVGVGVVCLGHEQHKYDLAIQ